MIRKKYDAISGSADKVLFLERPVFYLCDRLTFRPNTPPSGQVRDCDTGCSHCAFCLMRTKDCLALFREAGCRGGRNNLGAMDPGGVVDDTASQVNPAGRCPKIS